MYRFKFRHESAIRNYSEYFRLDLKAMKAEKKKYMIIVLRISQLIKVERKEDSLLK